MTSIFTCIENDKTIYCIRHICKFLNITNTTETTRRLDKSHIFNRKIKFGKSSQNGIMTDLYGLRFIITRTRSSKVKDLIQMLNINLHVVYSSDEAHFITILEESFSECKIHKQFSIDKYRIDMYFIDYKIAVEIDENNHINRDILYEEERELFITNKLKCVFIRFNPNEKLFNIVKIIFKIREYIKNYQIDKEDEVDDKQKNADVIAEKHKEYYEKNKEAVIEKVMEYYQENKESILEERKAYYQENYKTKIAAQRQKNNGKNTKY